MYARGFFDDERCVDIWGINLGSESRGVSETASHREENAENDLQSDVEE